MRSLWCMGLFIFLISGLAIGQEERNEEWIRQRVEFISEQLESEDIDLTNVTEQLHTYLDQPLNLNRATAEELESLGLLNEIQINDLLLHIQQFGKLISIYELQTLKYWDLQTIWLVLPFVRVDDRFDQLHVSLREALQQGKIETFLRYQVVPEQRAGYAPVPDSIQQQSNKYYEGNPDRYYTRLRYSYRTNLSVGITAEKDPGEAFFRGSQKQGFDFYSAHAYYKGGKYLKAVALGDYQVQIGQGLNLWSGYAFGKTADATNIRKNAQTLKPYSSVDESRFLRGAAIDLGFRRFGFTLFSSYKKTDAAILEDSLTDGFYNISGIYVTGLHRTASEIAHKNQLTEIIGGGELRYRRRNFTAGFATVYQGYDQLYAKAILPYNQFDFRGKQTISSSADYSFTWRNMHLFGELSRTSYSGQWAALQGLIIALDPKASLSILYRNYARAYQTFYNAGFSESGHTQNESGLYIGLRIRVKSAWTINSYVDVFQQPWLKYLVDAPGRGHEFLFQPGYKPNKQLEVYARYREQVRPKNSRDPDGTVTEIEDVRQRNYRLDFSYKATESIQLKSRLEYVTIHRESNMPEQGLLLTQDLVFRPQKFPCDISLRYALFNTDSYDSRLYSFEANALYVFAVPAYYYQGSRAYVLVRYTFLRCCDLWIRYGAFLYADRKTLSAGSEQINGNRKRDLTVQLRVHF
jgi:hypothetical protein